MKISVIIPVFNVEAYLSQAMESLRLQTHVDWEAVCVDDGSTDGSSGVLDEYKAADARFRVIHQRNSGTVIARKRAVAASTGDYLLFLDPDDWLDPAALATIAAALEKRPVDVLQYGASIHETGNRSAEARGVTEAYFNRDLPDTDGAGMLKAIYLDRTMSWGLITRVVASRLAKPAFAAMPDVHMINSTDLLATFYLVVRAKSFHRIQDRLYNYRYGSGISTQRLLSVDDFVRASRKLDSLLPLKDYVERCHPHDETIRRAYAAVDEIMVDSMLIAFQRRMAGDRERMLALDALTPARKVRNVAIMYHWMGFGGVQNVMVAAARALIDQGCRVTFLVEQPIAANGFQLPVGAEVEILPQSSKSFGYDREARRSALRRILAAREIDSVYSHAYNSVALADDALTCRLLCRIPFVVQFHTSFSAYYLRPALRGRIADVTLGLKLASAVIALSRTDELYFRLQGLRAEYLPNQVLPASPVDVRLRERSVVWCGRLSDEKRPLEAIRIFAKVLRIEPAARLTVLGSGTESVVSALRKEAESLGVAKSVEFPGFTDRPSAYFSKARVLLSTSVMEGFPMAIAEALNSGLPVVSYALPYLEVFEGNDGAVQVGQLESDAAAREVAAILRMSDAEYAKMSSAACDFMKRFRSVDYGGRLLGLCGGLRRDPSNVCLQEADAKRLSFIIAVMRSTVCEQANRLPHALRGIAKDWMSNSGVFTRKLVGGLRCLEENGLGYTMRHAVGKVCRRLGVSCGW